MNNIKNVFSIKDLENLSGVKAHTIRIWEKRYGILTPMRTDTNIRVYDLSQLRKLLNIILLHDHGYKISKIASFQDDHIPQLAREIISSNSAHNQAINGFKIAMMHFDQSLFLETYEKLIAEKSFREIFYSVFLPLLNELGLLWQSETITPAHEHFMSYLIRQKLLVHIEGLQSIATVKTDKTFVLYLPAQEIHQLGLLYLNYEILLRGYNAIYLGESVPLENLKDLMHHFKKIVFVTYLTLAPQPEDVTEYIATINREILDSNSELWFAGRQSVHCDNSLLNRHVRRFESITQLVEAL